MYKKLESWIEYQKDHTHWFIYEKSTNQPIGFISIEKLSDTKWGDVGLCIGNDFTKKGYRVETLESVIIYVKSL